MIHGLLRREPGNRRQHAERVRGEEDDVGRVPGHARNQCVLDEIQWVSRAGVLGDLVGIEIQQARFGVDHHVLQHGSEPDGPPDLGFLFFREPDALGIAAALKIEYALVAPAVLVVADQLAPRIGRQRGFARAGQAEEQRYVAFGSNIGRAVHGKDAALREEVIQYGEGGFLHLPGVLRAADQNHTFLEVQNDASFGVGAVFGGIGLKIRREQDGELGVVIGSLVRLGPDEELPSEEAMPGVLANQANGQRMGGIGAHEAILHEHVAALPERQHLGVQPVEVGFRHGLIDGAPLHGGVRDLVAHHELVFGRTSGELAGANNQPSAVGESAFPSLDRVF